MTNSSFPGLFYNDGKFSSVEDILADEESLSIAINGEPFTVTMRTPGFEEELIIGLLFTEEVYRDNNADFKIEIKKKNSKGFITEVNVIIPVNKILKDFKSSRNLVSASSCGLCGRTDFEDTITKNKITESIFIDPSMLEGMFAEMSKHQEAFRLSGGTHASAAFDITGKMLAIYEDIGRHNAVDKLVGALIIKQILPQAKFVTVSGRISYEIVNKVLSAGIPVLASFSAPSTMAVENAKESGMALMAFCRNKKLTVYAHPERIIQNENARVIE